MILSRPCCVCVIRSSSKVFWRAILIIIIIIVIILKPFILHWHFGSEWSVSSSFLTPSSGFYIGFPNRRDWYAFLPSERFPIACRTWELWFFVALTFPPQAQRKLYIWAIRAELFSSSLVKKKPSTDPRLKSCVCVSVAFHLPLYCRRFLSRMIWYCTLIQMTEFL